MVAAKDLMPVFPAAQASELANNLSAIGGPIGNVGSNTQGVLYIDPFGKLAVDAANFNYTGATARVGINTGSTTHALNIGNPGKAAGISIQNTSDPITNYERLAFNWTGNVATITTEAGGTGTARSLQLLSAATITLTPASTGNVTAQLSSGGSGAFKVRDSVIGDLWSWATTGKLTVYATNTAGGTTGAQTINKPSGTVNFAAAATSLVVTNNLVTTASLVFAVVRTADATAVIKNVVPAAGSFTITLTAAATAETSVGFWVIN